MTVSVQVVTWGSGGCKLQQAAALAWTAQCRSESGGGGMGNIAGGGGGPVLPLFGGDGSLRKGGWSVSLQYFGAVYGRLREI